MTDPKSLRDNKRPTPRAVERAKELRRELTPPEKRLWKALKGKKVDGLHFRTQAALGPYIADFYCHAARLVVEVDGGSHQGEQAQHDRQRDAWMQAQGIHVIRFPASDVRDNLDGVLQRIHTEAEKQLRIREQAKDPQ